MASQSRAAQEQLTELEKASAPFGEQLIEAAKFVDVDLDTVGRVPKEKRKSKGVVYHGREEWLLRWLLKKLQAPKDEVPRQSASAWWLFCHLVQSIPLPITARLLIEKKFTTILRQTLEDAQKAAGDSNTGDSGSTTEKKSSKCSKKRKRSPELVIQSENVGLMELLELLDAIYATVEFMTRSTKSITAISEEGRTAAFSAEYMRTAIKAPAQESATILGLWFSLSTEVLKSRKGTLNNAWLSPFIEIWNSRAVDDSELIQFSRHALVSLMSLLRASKRELLQSAEWTAQLEQLVARNVMIPAKTEKTQNAESVLLPTLARIPVITNTANAPIFFDIAIRSIVTHGTQRRRAEDEAWLQHVFTTMQDALLSQRPEENSEALCAMLQSAKKYKVDIELATLRTITSKFALPEKRDDWKLVAKLIALDANVFLIPDTETDLLNELLTRITKAGLQPEWADLADQVVLEVVVPLMNEFAKARDLSGFIRHWHDQLVAFEKLVPRYSKKEPGLFNAWEDEALQTELSKLLEPSLTLQQINQILDWLSTTNIYPRSVILDAIAGSISREETVDAMGTRLVNMISNHKETVHMNLRFTWRVYRILSRTSNWIMAPGLNEFSKLWEQDVSPFKALIHPASILLGEKLPDNTVYPNRLEMLRSACALWCAAKSGSQLEKLSRASLKQFLSSLAEDLKTFIEELTQNMDVGQSICGARLNTVRRDDGWMKWVLVKCIFVEYPKVLTLITRLPLPQKEFLQNIFWIASANAMLDTKIDWLQRNRYTFTDLWMFALRRDCVLDCPELINTMIDIMLDKDSNMGNPLIKSHGANQFAIASLQQLPLEVFSREHRERILISWLPLADNPISKVDALDPMVLALKINLARRSAFYEGMKFQDLLNLADALAELKTDTLKSSLALFKELVRLTLSQMTENMDQPQRRTYISECYNTIKQTVEQTWEKKRNKRWNFPLIALFEVVLVIFQSKIAPLADLDIIRTDELVSLSMNFNSHLKVQLDVCLKLEASTKRDHASLSKKERNSLLLLSTIEAWGALGVHAVELDDFKGEFRAFAARCDEVTFEVARKLETFMAVRGGVAAKKSFGARLRGDVSTVFGRQALLEKTRAATVEKDEEAKLKLLGAILGEELVGLTQLDKLLAAREVIKTCEDTRRSDEGEDNDKLDLSTAYSILCGHLWKATDTRQFCIISGTMELMLRTKPRSMSQWNIDSTLGSLTILSSRNGPSLRPQSSSTIYLHLCRLLQAILTSHRLKLQGHFHLVVQVMQTLLRCLFIPLPHSTTKTTKFLAPPPWLSSPKHQLSAKHAASFTRLVTLICDPSVSSVTRSQHNTLTSATDKAKRMAGQHMQFVLTTYIKLQLEMRMLPEVREKMVPGLYAIFDTTSPEMRRMISESLDGSGRAVFGGLYRDYARFGKWKGS